jgi:glycogen operon protein
VPGRVGELQRVLRARHRVELLLFDRVDDARPRAWIRIDPAANRTYHYWHVFVPGVTAGQLYGYRVEGPSTRARACASIPPRSCSIPMAAAWSCRRTTSQPRRQPGDNAAPR